MSLGPFLRRELVTSSRHWASFAYRSAAAGFVAAAIIVMVLASDLKGLDRTSIAGMADFARKTLGFVLVVELMLILAVVPFEVAPVLAGERERKTLDALLTSRLSAAEIVLGVVGAGLVKTATGIAAVLPVLLVLVLLGGVDMRAVVLVSAGLATTAFAVATISVLPSIAASSVREAVAGALALVFGWSFLPFTVVLFLPRLWPGGSRWLIPIALGLLDSSPFGVVENLIGRIRRCAPTEAVLRVIGLETAGGVLLVLWAIARLRPACRAAYDAEGARAGLPRWLRLEWPRLRPARGDNMLLWKEMFVLRNVGTFARIDRFLAPPLFLLCMGAVTYGIAMPALSEVLVHGYGFGSSAAGAHGAPEIHSLAWALRLSGRATGPALHPGQARADFNGFLRQMTGGFALLYVLMLGEIAAEGLGVERRRDTWSGLLATPLTGQEILRAKIIGAVWKSRWVAGLLVGFWSIGLLAGAIHPLGFLGAVVGLGVSGWSFAGLGTVQALRWQGTRRNDGRTLVPPLLLAVTGALVFLPPSRGGSVLMGAGSVPFLGWLALFSYDDVRAAFRPGAFPQLPAVGIGTGEGAPRVVITLLLGLILQVVGAVLLTRAAARRFDAIIGRPNAKFLASRVDEVRTTC